MAVLAAENVSYTYQSKYQKVQALKNVSCTFEAGKFYAIIGQSGSGKTTLLSMLAGLGTPSEGEIIVNGKTLKFFDANGNELQLNRGKSYIAFTYAGNCKVEG